MLRKQWIVISLIVVLMLSSCGPKVKEDEIVQSPDERTEQEISIVPSYQLSKENYKMILPFRPSEARGVITSQIANRLDIDEMEDGLRRLSTDVFDPEKYYFEEGQYITDDLVRTWIDELNPEKPKEGAKKKEFEENPRILSHILEQNFLKKTEDNKVQLVGVSIGVALKSVYKFQTETGGPSHYKEISKKEMLAEGKKVAEQIIERVRDVEGLGKVPIMIALYREEEQTAPVPGNFVAKANVKKQENAIGDWETIDEDYVLFPSDEAKKNHFDDYEIVKGFGNSIADYFPNYVGVIGNGFYMNDELKTLSIEVPIEFFGRAEVIGFTQYAYGLVKEMFPNYYDLEIKVVSSDKVESLITREAGEDDIQVHILH